MQKASRVIGGIVTMLVAGRGMVGVLLAGQASWAATNETAAVRVEITGYSERVIYQAPHSQESPGYTEWASLCQFPDGRLRCSFVQLSGPIERPLATFPLLESRDSGNTWTRVDVNQVPVDCKPAPTSGPGYWEASAIAPWYGLGMVVLTDGTFVKPGWGKTEKMDDSGYVERSEDGGKTWGKKIYFLPIEEYRTWPSVIRPLRDDRLVLMAGCWKRGDNTVTPNGAWGNMTKMMFISSDKGKTWSKPVVLMPTAEGSCEESDFCELPNGDLFWLHRVEHFPDHKTELHPFAALMNSGWNPPQCYWYSDRMQGITRKEGETFIPEKCEVAPLPHASRPLVIYAREGIILYSSSVGSYWTANLGKTWTALSIPGTAYNPVGMQLTDGTIMLMGHNGWDAAYGTVDSPIRQQTFRLKVTDPDAAIARKQKELEILSKEPSWGAAVFREDLNTMPTNARKVVSPKNNAPFTIADGVLRINAYAHTYAFLSMPLPVEAQGLVIKIRQGTDGGMSWGPGAALRFANGAVLRIGTRADNSIQADMLGKQSVGSSYRRTDWVWLRVRWLKEWGVVECSNDGKGFEQVWTFEHDGMFGGPTTELLFGKVPYTANATDYAETGNVGECEIDWVCLY